MAIPSELKSLDRWITWNYKEVEGKRRKAPNCKWTNKDNWNSYDLANSRCTAESADGVGIVLNGINEYSDRLYHFFDFDYCLDEHGEISDPVVQQLVNTLNSYTEKSVSGNGLHVVIATAHDDRFREIAKPFELYYGDAPRYLILTGDVYEGRDTIRAAHESQVYPLVEKYIEARQQGASVNQGDRLESGRYADAEHVKPAPIESFSPKVQKYLTEGAAPGGRSEAIYACLRQLHDGTRTAREIFATACTFPGLIQMISDKAESRQPDDFLWSEVNRIVQRSPIEPPKTPTSPPVPAHTESNPATPDDVITLISRVQRAVAAVTGASAEAVPVNRNYLTAMATRAYWSGKSRRLFILTNVDMGQAMEYGEREGVAALERWFGPVLDASQFGENGMMDDPTDDWQDVRSAYSSVLLNHFKDLQAEELEIKTDPFTAEPRVDIRRGVAFITRPYTRVEIDVPVVDDTRGVIADYKEHFPALDDVLDFLVAGRFASNRKRSYLWLHADSDWGKTFFIDMLRRGLNCSLVTETSVKEVESMFEGKALGRAPQEFLWSLAMFFDEFRGIKSELKQLDSDIQLSPKFRMTTRVPIYTKIFASAESVLSLIGEHGVEDQFANRMSYIQGTGKITERELFKQNGDNYFAVCQTYVLKYCAERFEEFRVLGRRSAAETAWTVIESFHKKYGLDNQFERLSDSVEMLGVEFVEWIWRLHKAAVDGQAMGRILRGNVEKVLESVIEHDGAYLLRNPSSLLSAFLEEHIDRPERATISRRKPEILRVADGNNQGIKVYRVGKKLLKGITLKAK